MFPGACGVGNACGTPLGWFSLIFSLWEVANRPQRLKIQKRPKTGPRKCHHPIGRNGLFQAPQVPRPNFGPFGPHGDPPPLFLGCRIHFCNLFVMVLPFWKSNVGVMCPYPHPPKGPSAFCGDGTGDRYLRPPALEGNFRDAPGPPMSAVEREGVIGLNGEGRNQQTIPHAGHMPGTHHTPLLGYKFSNL